MTKILETVEADRRSEARGGNEYVFVGVRRMKEAVRIGVELGLPASESSVGMETGQDSETEGSLLMSEDSIEGIEDMLDSGPYAVGVVESDKAEEGHGGNEEMGNIGLYSVVLMVVPENRIVVVQMVIVVPALESVEVEVGSEVPQVYAEGREETLVLGGEYSEETTKLVLQSLLELKGGSGVLLVGSERSAEETTDCKT